LNAALGKHAKSLAEWILLHLVGLCSLTLVVTLLLINLSTADGASIVLDPGIAASYLLNVFGVTDQSWLDAFLTWLRRPELAGVAMAASAFVGVALLRWRRHGTEVAWIVLILASTAVGPNAVTIAGLSFGVTVAFLLVPSIWENYASPRERCRGRVTPSIVLGDSVVAVVDVLLTPLIPVFRIMNGLNDRFTYDLSDRRTPPTGSGKPGIA
jgi:hypothetical protein